MYWWMAWWEMWMRAAMLPLQVMTARDEEAMPAKLAVENKLRSREDFLTRRLRTELETRPVEDLIEGRF